jgi:hypothetical protein
MFAGRVATAPALGFNSEFGRVLAGMMTTYSNPQELDRCGTGSYTPHEEAKGSFNALRLNNQSVAHDIRFASDSTMLFSFSGRLERVRGEIAEVQSVMVQNIGMRTHRHEASQKGSRSSAIPFVS